MTFRKQLLAERTRLDLTQAGCAKLLGLSLRNLIRWEHGVIVPAAITQEGCLARLAALPTHISSTCGRD